MRKLYSVLVLLFFAFSTYAQNAHTVFITDAEISWLDKEVGTLTAAYDDMKAAVETQDYKVIASKKTALIKSVNRMSTNSNIMRQKIETEVTPPAKNANADLDTPPDYYYNKKKNTQGLQELKLSKNNWSTFAQNAIALKQLKDELKENFNLGPRFTETDGNMAKVAQMIELAKTNNSIITRSKVY